MRVAIVSAVFDPKVSYQENIWAEQLTQLGHQVRAIAAGKPSLERIEYPFGVVELERVPSVWLPRYVVLSKAVGDAVRRFAPDLVMVIGDKQFARQLSTDKRLSGIPVVPFFSENSAQREADWRKPGLTPAQRAGAMAYYLYRGGAIRAISRRAALISANTPQSRDIILSVFNTRAERARINEKIVDLPLGFSPNHFHFDPAVRRRVREALGVGPDEVLACASSRFAPDKEPFLTRIIDGLSAAMREDANLRAVLVGFDESVTSRRLGAKLDAMETGGRFLHQPFASRNRLSELFNAADIAIFGRASVSCQEALGTGVFECLSNGGALSHLLKTKEQGLYFDPMSSADLTDKLRQGLATLRRHPAGEAREAFRRRMVEASRWLGYDQTAQRLMQLLRERGWVRNAERGMQNAECEPANDERAA